MSQPQMQFRFPKPGKALIGVMVTLGCIWVMFAVGLNWAGGGQGLLEWLIGDTDKVLGGQVWRLFTAALIHHPSSPGHLFVVLLVLYFLGAPLEERWGPKRTLMFLVGATGFAFAMQVLLGIVIPALAAPQWFGAMGMAEAAAVAWAMGARGQTVRLFFLIPVTPMLMVGFILVLSVINVLARTANPEGLITPFGGMAAGYLFSETSPLRRLYLKLKLKKLQADVAAMKRRGGRSRRGDGPKLRVIKGGVDDPNDDDEPPSDKRMLH